MGQNVNADLAYGVDCGVEESIWAEEKVQEEVEDGGDIMEVVAKVEGLVSPYDSVPDEINRGSQAAFDEWKASQPNFQTLVDTYYAEKKKLEEACPLTVEWYGSLYDGITSHVLAVKGFVISGGWEGTVALDLERLVGPDDETLAKCTEYAEKYGLKWGAPRWLLFGGLG